LLLQLLLLLLPPPFLLMLLHCFSYYRRQAATANPVATRAQVGLVSKRCIARRRRTCSETLP